MNWHNIIWGTHDGIASRLKKIICAAVNVWATAACGNKIKGIHASIERQFHIHMRISIRSLECTHENYIPRIIIINDYAAMGGFTIWAVINSQFAQHFLANNIWKTKNVFMQPHEWERWNILLLSSFIVVTAFCHQSSSVSTVHAFQFPCKTLFYSHENFIFFCFPSRNCIQRI